MGREEGNKGLERTEKGKVSRIEWGLNLSNNKKGNLRGVFSLSSTLTPPFSSFQTLSSKTFNAEDSKWATSIRDYRAQKKKDPHVGNGVGSQGPRKFLLL